MLTQHWLSVNTHCTHQPYPSDPTFGAKDSIRQDRRQVFWRCARVLCRDMKMLLNLNSWSYMLTETVVMGLVFPLLLYGSNCWDVASDSFGTSYIASPKISTWNTNLCLALGFLNYQTAYLSGIRGCGKVETEKEGRAYKIHHQLPSASQISAAITTTEMALHYRKTSRGVEVTRQMIQSLLDFMWELTDSIGFHLINSTRMQHIGRSSKNTFHTFRTLQEWSFTLKLAFQEWGNVWWMSITRNQEPGRWHQGYWSMDDKCWKWEILNCVLTTREGNRRGDRSSGDVPGCCSEIQRCCLTSTPES